MIAIGCDHGGFDLKQAVIAYLEENHWRIRTLAVLEKSPAIILNLAKQRQWQLQQENAIAEL